MSDPGDTHATLISNERAKLTATYMNGIAVAVLAVGGVAPLFTQRPPGAADPVVAFGTAVTSLVCLLICGILHWAARNVLNGLR